MYVLHPFILAAMRERGFRYSLSSFALCLAAVYGAAWLSWLLLERRFLALKNKYTDNSEITPTATVSTLAAG